MMKNIKNFSFTAFAALASAGTLASGYNFGTQSVSSLSTADASAAEAADAGTIYYNPAGLTYLDGIQVSGNLILARPSVKVKNAKGFYHDGTPVAGSSDGSIASGITAVPHLYASWKINPSLALGFGIYVPFGADVEYSRDTVLRYTVNKTKLETIDFNPTIAFKINEQHSIGFGIIAQYAKAKLRKNANFAPALSAIPGITIPNGQAEGIADLEADDWGLGFNAGWMWDINDNVRVGASYRSQVSHHLKGTAKWHLEGAAFSHPAYGSRLEQAIRNSGYVASEGGGAKIITPESVSLHGMWHVNPKTDLFGNITWTRHSRFKDLNIKLDNTKRTLGGPSDTSRIFPGWRNSWRVSLGGSYQITDPLQLRAGISYDQSPVKNPDHRLSTLPDNDRYWLSLGAKYDFSKDSTLNLGYSYMIVKDGSGKFHACPGACVDSKTTGTADYKANAHFFGMQYTHRF